MLAESDLNMQRLNRKVDNNSVAIEECVRDIRTECIGSDDLEAVRVEVMNTLERIKMEDLEMRSEGLLSTSNKENNNNYNYNNNQQNATAFPFDKTALLDEIAISRPSISEITNLLTTRLEPVAASLQNLQMSFGEMQRHVSSLPPVPKGLVSDEMLGETVSKAVKNAVVADGGR